MSNVKDVYITCGDLLNKSVAEYGNAEALIYEDGRCYSWIELKENVDTLAKGLLALGINKGDKVAVWLSNSPEWVFLYYAISKVGAILVPINTRFKEKDLDYILKQSDTSILIMGNPNFKEINYFDTLVKVCPEIVHSEPGNIQSNLLPKLKTVISLNEESYPGTYAYEGIKTLGKSIKDDDLQARESSIRVNDTYMIMYTSGTTGFPKGVMHSHTVIKNLANVAQRFELTPNDRMLIYLPLFHAFGLLTLLTSAHTVGTTVILMETFQAGKALKLIEKEKVTFTASFEAMFLDIIRHPEFEKFEKQSLRAGLCPVPGYIAQQIDESLMPALNGYGMTELGAVASLASFQDSPVKRLHSVGRPLPGVSLKVVDPETGEELPPNKPGDLCVKGFNVMQGYYNKPEENQKSFDPDGWFHTGDLCYLDEEGYLFSRSNDRRDGT